MNAPLEPSAQPLFRFRWSSATVERIHGHAVSGEINKAAGYLFFSNLGRNKLHEPAFLAGVWPRGIGRIRTAGGILENVRSAPGRARMMPVASLVKKLKFVFEELQDPLAIVSHGLASPRESQVITAGSRAPVTQSCDCHHSIRP